MISMGIFELISIISIFPLISLISSPDIIYEKPALFFIYNLLNFNSPKDFIIFSGFFCLVAFSLSIGIKTLTNYLQILFLQECEFELGRQLFTKLKVYKGSDHPHSAQEPKILNLKSESLSK